MVERRSMGAALALTPEQRAFIHGDKTGAEAGQGPEPEKVQVAERPPEKEEFATDEPVTGNVRTARRGRRPKAPLSEASQDLQSGGYLDDLPQFLISLTTRLSPGTAEALRRAALEQKLDRRRPHTQQEIIEAAVRTWLKTNGFLQAA